MTENEYEQLSNDLKVLAKIVPLNWGFVQNNGTDNKINMFQINSFSDLEIQISSFKEEDKNYFRRRWFLWKCAQCDEYIFNLNHNVVQNPNSRDQAYDIEFNGNSQLRFDVKGTVIPLKFRNDINEIVQDPTRMINFFYEEQSRGVRNNIQNRLFIIHHSYRAQEREMYLRCHWEFKLDLYREYSSRIASASSFINYRNTKSDVIFIFENLDKTITYNFFAV
ncbi:hypothetical protein [Flavobacterium sp. K5-23]|uniref:hypothetical protein n=1 Tax=Flavobacterium sp. K5-23 TaxID=2746225 RepID=UPI00200DC995|nr:hypothetical protein [Flavobacterium sp. K5-23]UQD56265.1 hypothetical protein FLAK523_07630 [Flavobacterium sp. K5-23]